MLYYATALDSAILTAINDIGITQAKPTEYTREECQQILDYAATYPNLVIRYYTSNMILHIDSNTAYLVLSNAKSQIAGFFYLSKKEASIRNAPILVSVKILQHVVSSAAEAEISRVFINAQLSIPIHHNLMLLDYL